jgi:hypothetical protein
MTRSMSMVLFVLLVGVVSCRSSQGVGWTDCRQRPGLVASINQVAHEIDIERLAPDGGAADINQ